MIPNGEGWHYLAVTNFAVLLREITSKHQDYCYCLNFLYSFAIESKHKSHIKLCTN